MSGETNLTKLLASMSPACDNTMYGFATLDKTMFSSLSFDPKCMFVEEEGITVIATIDALVDSNIECMGPFACITLTVHSSLEAVGLTAAFATALGQANISANVVAAYYHDHIFVDWADKDAALRVLGQLATANSAA